jgi:hypothetical protein
VSILESAFVKYLKTLDRKKRTAYLKECAHSGGEMFYELAEELKEHDPEKISDRLEEMENL